MSNWVLNCACFKYSCSMDNAGVDMLVYVYVSDVAVRYFPVLLYRVFIKTKNSNIEPRGEPVT